MSASESDPASDTASIAQASSLSTMSNNTEAATCPICGTPVNSLAYHQRTVHQRTATLKWPDGRQEKITRSPDDGRFHCTQCAVSSVNAQVVQSHTVLGSCGRSKARARAVGDKQSLPDDAAQRKVFADIDSLLGLKVREEYRAAGKFQAEQMPPESSINSNKALEVPIPPDGQTVADELVTDAVILARESSPVPSLSDLELLYPDDFEPGWSAFKIEEQSLISPSTTLVGCTSSPSEEIMPSEQVVVEKSAARSSSEPPYSPFSRAAEKTSLRYNSLGPSVAASTQSTPHGISMISPQSAGEHPRRPSAAPSLPSSSSTPAVKRKVPDDFDRGQLGSRRALPWFQSRAPAASASQRPQARSLVPVNTTPTRVYERNNERTQLRFGASPRAWYPSQAWAAPEQLERAHHGLPGHPERASKRRKTVVPTHAVQAFLSNLPTTMQPPLHVAEALMNLGYYTEDMLDTLACATPEEGDWDMLEKELLIDKKYHAWWTLVKNGLRARREKLKGTTLGRGNVLAQETPVDVLKAAH